MRSLFVPVGLLSATCLTPCAAIAQSAATPPGSTASQPDSGVLEEIIVTAQKRNERLVDVPIAVTSLTANEIAATGVKGTSDLMVAVPGLSFNSLAGGQAVPRLRGIGNSTAGPGIEPGVAVYVDGVYRASAPGSLVNFNELNLDSIQVLKGPQGTLFGRNATGGVVQVVSRTPGQDFKLAANVGYGNYETYQGALYVAGGVAPNLAVSFAANGTFMGDGYGKNLATGKDVGRTKADFALASKIVFEPSDTTRFMLAGDYNKFVGTTYAERLKEGSIPAFGTTPTFSSNPNDVDSDTDWNSRVKSGGVALTIDQKIGDALTLKSISAYRQLDSNLQIDLDDTRTRSSSVFPVERDTQFTQELQLQSARKSRFNWTIGGYYFMGRGLYRPNRVAFYNNPFVPFDLITINSKQKTDAVAVFAQADYEIVPKLVVTVGVRENHEKRSVAGTQDFSIRGFTIFTVPGKQNKSFDKATFRGSLSYHFTPDAQVYVSFNRGFKSGGFDTGGFTNPAFVPEIIDAYEIGAKAEILDRRVRIEGAGFYYDYKNIQVQQVLNGSLAVLNGGPAKIYGAEGDITARIGSAFRVNVGGIYIWKAKYLNFPTATNSAPNGGVPLTYDLDASGNRLAIVPKFSGSASLNYSVPLGENIGTIDANVAVSYTSSFFWTPANNFREDRYTLLNANLKWTAASEKFSVSLYGRNLTNVAYNSNGTDNGNGARAVGPAAPRTYGVTLGFKY